MTGAWWEYGVVFVGSAILCVSLTPLALRLAFRSGALDHPGEHKGHDSPMPFLGGISIVTAFSGAILVVAILRPPVGLVDAGGGLSELVMVLGIAVTLGLVGLVDDLRQLSPRWRVAAEVAASVAVWFMGTGVKVTDSEALNLGLTVFWIVGITNAFNLLDNMDGLAAGLGAITCLTFFALAATNGQFLVAALSIGLVGCTAGFLRYNFYPAQIYMGDGGALFIGFLIAYLGLKLQLENTSRLESALVPILACSAAIFDTTLVTVSRLSTGRSPFQGGQDHVSHRLVKIGLPVPVAVGAIYCGAAGIGTLSFMVGRIDPSSAKSLTFLVGAVLFVVGVLLLTIPVYPESTSRPWLTSQEPPDD